MPNNLRPAVRWFAERMEAKLQDNDYKGGWEHELPERLMCLLVKEVGELSSGLEAWRMDDQWANAVIAECADVANFTMMIADLVRQKGNTHDE